MNRDFAVVVYSTIVITLQMTGVKVSVGNAGPFFYACIRYETAELIEIGKIVGIVVVIGVPLIILIIIVIVCVCKRRRKKKKKANDNGIDIEMSPVVPNNGAPADKRTPVERSVFRFISQPIIQLII